LQTYIVQLPAKARELLLRNGHASFVRPDLRGDQFAVLHNMSFYNSEMGLLWEDAEYLALENSVI
jgi:CRISPR-associated endonuclease/helicase Cas3